MSSFVLSRRNKRSVGVGLCVLRRRVDCVDAAISPFQNEITALCLTRGIMMAVSIFDPQIIKLCLDMIFLKKLIFLHNCFLFYK